MQHLQYPELLSIPQKHLYRRSISEALSGEVIHLSDYLAQLGVSNNLFSWGSTAEPGHWWARCSHYA